MLVSTLRISVTCGPFGPGPDEAKSFVRVVPLDDGSDGWTRGCFKTQDARPRRKSEVAGWRLVVVVVETMAAGRAKISVSGAHVGFLGELTLTLRFGPRIVNELFLRNGLPKGIGPKAVATDFGLAG